MNRRMCAAAVALASLPFVAACASDPPKPAAVVTLADPPVRADAPAVRAAARAECDALIHTINAGVDALARPASKGDSDGIADLEAMAKTLDGVAAQVDAVHVGAPDLAVLAAEYQAMVEQVAKSARAVAAAARAKDVEAIQRATLEMDRAVKREDPLVDRINVLCAAR